MLDSNNNNNQFKETELKKMREEILKWIEQQEKKEQKSAKKPALKIKPSPVKIKPAEEINGKKTISQITTSLEKPLKNFKKKTGIFQFWSKIKKDKKTKRTAEEKVIKETMDEKIKKVKPVSKPIKKTRISREILVPPIIAVIIYLILGIGIYIFNWNNDIILAIAKRVPFPALIVNNYSISYFNYLKNYNALTKIYQQKQFLDYKISKAEIKKKTTDKLLENEIVRQTAKKYGIVINDQELNRELTKIISGNTMPEYFKKVIYNLYGWNTNEFKIYILKPFLLRQKLLNVLENNPQIIQQTKEKAEKILQDIRDNKISFEEAARRYSDDYNSSIGGDLGYFSKGRLSQILENTLLTLDRGAISEIIKTNNSFQIIRLDEIIYDNFGEILKIRASNILIEPKIDLDNIINQEIQKAKVWRLIK